MSNQKRRTTFIDATVQGQLVRRIFLHWLSFFAVVGMMMWFMSIMMGDPSKAVAERMTDSIGPMIMLGIVMAAILPAFMLDTIRFSNRFVGPVTRLRRAMRSLGTTDDIAPLQFRDNDFWAEAADEFNTVLEKCNRQQEELRRLKEKLGANSETVSS